MASTGRGKDPLKSIWSSQAPIRKPVVDGSDGVAAKAAWTDWFFGATAGASFTSTATWSQAPATWDAAAVERFAATATYAQTSTWSAGAAERFIVATSALQDATWAAVAVERLIATAGFAQSSTWAATAGTQTPIAPVTMSAAFAQEPAAFAGKAIKWIIVLVWSQGEV